jgi:arabinose-5-phosphate isomerase
VNIKARMAFIIQKEAEAISNIDVTDDFEKAINLLLACPGKIITTGIGKAGYVANKFSATLEAGHGDLGMVNPEDTIIAFSTSGKSIEVVEMLENARQLGVSRVIGITSHVDSPLRNLSELILDMGSNIVEPCPLKVTPSASIAVMQAISDALALTLMELKGFTTHDYGMRHHKGYLGSITRKQHQYDD